MQRHRGCGSQIMIIGGGWGSIAVAGTQIEKYNARRRCEMIVRIRRKSVVDNLHRPVRRPRDTSPPSPHTLARVADGTR